MPRVTGSDLASYETVSQAFISLGRLYYEKHRDDPGPEAKDLIESIDNCLLDINKAEAQGSAVPVVEQPTKTEATAAPISSTSNEVAPASKGGNLSSTDNKALKQCPYCDASLPVDAKVCSTCGSSLS